jgi:hypothetical protein
MTLWHMLSNSLMLPGSAELGSTPKNGNLYVTNLPKVFAEDGMTSTVETA